MLALASQRPRERVRRLSLTVCAARRPALSRCDVGVTCTPPPLWGGKARRCFASLHCRKRHHAARRLARRPCPVSVRDWPPGKKAVRPKIGLVGMMFKDSNACIGAGNSFRCMNYALWLLLLLLGFAPTVLFFQDPFVACNLHVLHADTRTLELYSFNYSCTSVEHSKSFGENLRTLPSRE